MSQVMVVEDLETMREAMELGLLALGHDVILAIHGADALALLRAGARPAVILLDQTMPVMDGPTLLGHLVDDEDLCAIPVVICSSEAPPRSGRLALAYKHFLRKPFTIDDLQLVVERYAIDPTGNHPGRRGPAAGHIRRWRKLMRPRRLPTPVQPSAFDVSLHLGARARELHRRARLERAHSAHLRSLANALCANRAP